MQRMATVSYYAISGMHVGIGIPGCHIEQTMSTLIRPTHHSKISSALFRVWPSLKRGELTKIISMAA